MPQDYNFPTMFIKELLKIPIKELLKIPMGEMFLFANFSLSPCPGRVRNFLH